MANCDGILLQGGKKRTCVWQALKWRCEYKPDSSTASACMVAETGIAPVIQGYEPCEIATSPFCQKKFMGSVSLPIIKGAFNENQFYV